MNSFNSPCPTSTFTSGSGGASGAGAGGAASGSSSSSNNASQSTAAAGSEVQWCFSQVKGTLEDDVTEADIISCVEFNQDGDLLATGDKGGRVVIFQRDPQVFVKFLSNVK